MAHLFVVPLLGIIAVACANEATPHRAEELAEHPHWSYEGETGPEHWGTLDKDFKTCEAGTRQSPINIHRDQQAGPQDTLTFRYQPSHLRIVNNGHTVQMNYAPGSHVIFDGTTYELKQFHLHAPSEHHVQGVTFQMEMHLVHQSEAGRMLVVGVLMERDDPNPVFKQMGDWAERRLGYRIPQKGEEIRPDLIINARDLLPEDTEEYYAYPGSLTTPPCTQGVQWIVLKEPTEVSEGQVQRFIHTIGHNARPLQPLHGR